MKVEFYGDVHWFLNDGGHNIWFVEGGGDYLSSMVDHSFRIL